MKLVDALSRTSPEFAALSQENDVARHADGTKRLRHPEIAWVKPEFSAFPIDGRPILGMTAYNPATPEMAERIRSRNAARASAPRAADRVPARPEDAA